MTPKSPGEKHVGEQTGPLIPQLQLRYAQINSVCKRFAAGPGHYPTGDCGITEPELELELHRRQHRCAVSQRHNQTSCGSPRTGLCRPGERDRPAALGMHSIDAKVARGIPARSGERANENPLARRPPTRPRASGLDSSVPGSFRDMTLSDGPVTSPALAQRLNLQEGSLDHEFCSCLCNEDGRPFRPSFKLPSACPAGHPPHAWRSTVLLASSVLPGRVVQSEFSQAWG